MKRTIPYILALFIVGCATSRQTGKELLANNKNIEIAQVLTISDNDSLYFNELRLHLSSALYTQKFMFKKFGHWDEVVPVTGNKHYLIWKKCKLFEGKDEFYTVAASGVENRNEMYASVIIQDKDNVDLLAENSKLKDTLVSMFHYGTKNITFSKDEFYNAYHKMREQIE